MATGEMNLDQGSSKIRHDFITNPAENDSVRGALAFDDTLDEEGLWSITLNDYASDLSIIFPWYMIAATSGNIEIKADVMKIEDGDSAVETASFATSNDTGAIAVPGTAEDETFTALALSNDDSPSGAQVTFHIRLKRNTSVTGNASGDMIIGPGPIFLSYTKTA